MPQFLILADDFMDPDAISRRLTFREEHLKRLREEKLKGHFIIGGAKINECNQMVGSMLVIQLDNEEEVRVWLEEDPYTTARVWEEVEVIPFRVADV
jgi:uncharacterized protein YciI